MARSASACRPSSSSCSATCGRGLAEGLRFDLRRYNAALNRRDRLIAALEGFLDSWDILLCPVASTPAYPHIPASKFGKPPTVPVDGQPLPSV